MLRFKSLKDPRILWLSFCFAVLFFAFNGVEQFFAVFYSETGLTNLALMALILIYGGFSVSSFFAPLIVGKLGLKKSLIFPGIFYSLFVVAVAAKNPTAVLALALLLGIAAGPLAVARGTYLLKSAEESKTFGYGEALGAQDSLRAIGSTLGVLTVGVLSKILSMEKIFFLMGGIILFASFAFSRVKSLESESKSISFSRIKGVLKDPKVWLICPTFFASVVMLGLSISTLPLVIKEHYSNFAVGAIMSVFSLAPIILSISIGKLSDRGGGKHRISVVGLALFGGAAAGAILLFSHHIFWLVLATLLVTLLFTTVNSAGEGLIGQFFPEEKWEGALGVTKIFDSLGVLVPLITEQVFPRNITLYATIFFCLGALFLLGVLARKER